MLIETSKQEETEMKKPYGMQRWFAALISAAILCSAVPAMPAHSADETTEQTTEQTTTQTTALTTTQTTVQTTLQTTAQTTIQDTTQTTTLTTAQTTAQTTTQITEPKKTNYSFEELRQMFPAGRYWNHMGMEQNNSNGTTDIPCNHNLNGLKYCNDAGSRSYQCYGYAKKLGLLLYGTWFETWEHDRNMDTLKAGDIIMTNYTGSTAGHTIMVTGVKGDTIYYTDCNSNGTCIIKWDYSRSKDYYEGKFLDETEAYRNGVYHAPFEATDHFDIPGHIMTEDEAAGQTVPDGDYWIINSLNHDYFLHISTLVKPEGTNVQMFQWENNVPTEKFAWTVAYQNNGFYTIKQKNTENYLSVSDDSTNAGTNVVLLEKDDSDMQLWSIETTENGYEIRSKCGAWYLDVYCGMVQFNRNVQVWKNDLTEQTWGFVPYKARDEQTIPDGMYYVRSASDPEYYLSVKDEQGMYKTGCTIQLSKEKKDAFSIALFQINDGFYGIRYPFSKTDSTQYLYLDVNTESETMNHLEEGRGMVAFRDYLNTRRRGLRWDIRPTGSGTFYISAQMSGYCLTSDAAANGDEANLSQRRFTDALNQKWVLEPVEQTENRIPGDINYDGVCNQADAGILQRWLLAAPDAALTDWKAGDLNGDGILTAVDLSMLKARIAELQEAEPA